MKPVSLLRAVAVLVFLSAGACSLVLKDYKLDTTLLDNSVCEAGDVRCDADWLVSCNATLDGWVRTTACDAPGLCNAGARRCDACRAGAYRCDAARLERCEDDGSGWTLVEDCRSGDNCNENLQACVACTPDEDQCIRGVPSRCVAGVWQPGTSCGGEERCRVATDRKSASCLTVGVCTPEAYSCEGAVLTRCDKHGATKQPIETCATAELCAQARSGTGALTCPPPLCKEGTSRCNGNTVQTCPVARTGFVDSPTVCSADNPCNPATGACGKCTPGAFFCQEASLLRCEASGVFAKVADCDAAALCDAASGQCTPAECPTPGRGECEIEQASGLPFLKVCGADLKWSKPVFCDSRALCDVEGGSCLSPVCELGDERCNQNRYEVCNSDKTGWVVMDTCGAANPCDLAANGCGSACMPGSRCNDVFLETCSAGVWTRTKRCHSHGLCDPNAMGGAGACIDAMCGVPGTYVCMGADLRVCQANGAFKDALTCSDTQQCDAVSKSCK